MTTEGLINHFSSVRLRVRGTGNLLMRFMSLDDVYDNVLIPLIMIPLTNIEPTTKSNFTEQRALLEIKTTVINETFEISKIVIYVKPVATNYPG